MLTEAVPFVQLSFFMRTAVTAPIRSVLMILGMVLEWKEPSSVTWHLTVTSGLENSSLDQLILMFWVSVERFLAEAVLSALASSRAATSAVSPSFAELRIKMPFVCGRQLCLRPALNVVSRAGGVAKADHGRE